MKSEIINVPGKGVCILISEIDLSDFGEDIPSFNLLFNDIHGIADEIRNGRKIGAIKKVREQTKWGLKEAKDYIDQYMITGVYTAEDRNAGVEASNADVADKFIRDHALDDFLNREEMNV